jgi:hypothetical protein
MLYNAINMLANPSNYISNNRYIFILSHMRSRSSLLSHILGSNREINGHSELHQNYTGRKSLLEMKLNIYQNWC